jgi:hypothetical protein
MGTAIVIHIDQVEEVRPAYGPWSVRLGAREKLLATKAYEDGKNIRLRDVAIADEHI